MQMLLARIHPFRVSMENVAYVTGAFKATRLFMFAIHAALVCVENQSLWGDFRFPFPVIMYSYLFVGGRDWLKNLNQ